MIGLASITGFGDSANRVFRTPSLFRMRLCHLLPPSSGSSRRKTCCASPVPPARPSTGAPSTWWRHSKDQTWLSSRPTTDYQCRTGTEKPQSRDALEDENPKPSRRASTGDRALNPYSPRFDRIQALHRPRSSLPRFSPLPREPPSRGSRRVRRVPPRPARSPPTSPFRDSPSR
jgi:hypothetical protein